MPVSPHAPISPIMDLIVHLQPRSILDIGCGFGKYGILCREYLDLWEDREDFYTWKVQIDGIDIFEKYRNPIWDFVYDSVYIGDVLESPELKTYDLILIIDVLEHMESIKAGMFLNDLHAKGAKHIIISTPKDIGHQKTLYGNEHEAHVSQWDFNSISRSFPVFNSALCYSMGSWIVYTGEDYEEVARREKQKEWNEIKRLVKGYFKR